MTNPGTRRFPAASALLVRPKAMISGFGTFLAFHTRPGAPHGSRLCFGPLSTFGGANE
jgi:hypothetical protein